VVHDRIRHTVVFTLIHRVGSEDESDFLDAAERLAAIPGVEAFELLAEISPKNDYRFGISMEFPDRGAYERYNAHPDHVRFVQERWLSEVADFLEIDYAAR
jgi:Stress responsive A/B Barrel Domain